MVASKLQANVDEFMAIEGRVHVEPQHLFQTGDNHSSSHWLGSTGDSLSATQGCTGSHDLTLGA